MRDVAKKSLQLATKAADVAGAVPWATEVYVWMTESQIPRVETFKSNDPEIPRWRASHRNSVMVGTYDRNSALSDLAEDVAEVLKALR